MTGKTPHDYDSADGWTDNGLEKCPHCGRQLSGEAGHHGAVYEQSGRKYTHLTDTDPGDGPFFCPECWPELDANRRAKENKTLTEWSG